MLIWVRQDLISKEYVVNPALSNDLDYETPGVFPQAGICIDYRFMLALG